MASSEDENLDQNMEENSQEQVTMKREMPNRTTRGKRYFGFLLCRKVECMNLLGKQRKKMNNFGNF